MIKLASFMLMLLLTAWLFLACNEDSGNDNTDGDMQLDGDADAEAEAAPDGDIDRDSAESAPDGDADSAVSESDTDPDTDRDGDTEPDTEPDSDGDAEPELEAEADSEPEAEAPNPIVTESFPFATTTIVPCSGKSEDFSFSGVWGDNSSHVYFGGIANEETAPFWVYDQNSDTFTCDPNVTDFLFDVNGRQLGDEAEIWVEAKDKIGRLYQNQWTFIAIPDVEPFSNSDLLMPSGIRVTANGKIAVWGNWGLAFYDFETEIWKRMEFCSGMDTNTILSGYWLEDMFYMPGGCSLYEIDADDLICNVVYTFSECESTGTDELFSTGIENGQIWLSQISTKSSVASENGALTATIVFDIANNSKTIYAAPDLSLVCRDHFALDITTKEMSYPYSIESVAVSGVAGMPSASYVRAMTWAGGDLFNYAIAVSTSIRVVDSMNDNHCLASDPIKEEQVISTPSLPLTPSNLFCKFSRAWRDDRYIWFSDGYKLMPITVIDLYQIR